MKSNEKTIRTCPFCGKEFTYPPAMSRTDGVTPVCRICSAREALEYLGISDDEREKIISIVRQHEDC